MKNSILLLGITLFCASLIAAQQRPVDKPAAPAAAMPQAPPQFPAKYEGGMFGYNQREEGTLRFDDSNERLVFIGKDQREKFHVPYKSLLMIYPQSRSVRTTTGTVVSHIPLPGAGLAGLLREKRRYLIMHFDDPDIETAKGVLSFKLGNKDLLNSVIRTLGAKAKLSRRGEAYYRPSPPKGTI
ncbi:MAG: hypothetical protein LC734_05550 [Acidobacteria bacterium]|nr:hypothetical protein [Acidobacteriota bacterium]